MEKVTFVISTYEDIPTTIDTINSLLETTVGHEKSIIVVDDANTIKHELDIFPEVKVYRNETRRGVGFSLSRGLILSETEINFLLGNDIRFSGDWLPRFYEVVKNNPKSMVCTVTAGLNLDRLQITGKENHFFGAHALFKVTVANNSKPALPFREYAECKWNGKIEGDVEQIGAVLGAFYGIHKSWGEHINLWKSHVCWGSLEIQSALQCYINGGNCLIDTKTVTGHIFKSASSHKPIRDLIYNKLMIAYCYLPTDMEAEIFAWAKTLQHSEGSFLMIERNKAELNEMRALKNSLGDEKIRELIRPSGILD